MFKSEATKELERKARQKAAEEAALRQRLCEWANGVLAIAQREAPQLRTSAKDELTLLACGRSRITGKLKRSAGWEIPRESSDGRSLRSLHLRDDGVPFLANGTRLEFNVESPSFDDAWELAKFLIRHGVQVSDPPN